MAGEDWGNILDLRLSVGNTLRFHIIHQNFPAITFAETINEINLLVRILPLNRKNQPLLYWN
jgi:hypothetical protein